MIARVTIEEGWQFTAGGGVYNLIYPRQTEGVFRAVFVKISVINAHSPFFILFEQEQGLPTTQDGTLLLLIQQLGAILFLP